MSSKPPDPSASPPGGPCEVARLTGADPSPNPGEEAAPEEELLPTWDVPDVPAAAPAPPDALPVAEAVPVADARAPEPAAAAEPAAAPEAAPPAPAADLDPGALGPELAPRGAARAGRAPLLCPVGQSPHNGSQPSCPDCGYYFSQAELAGPEAPSEEPPGPAVRLQDRFEVGARIDERQGVVRYRGLDHGDG